MTKKISSVKKFWNENPLFTGEIKKGASFFEEADNTYINKNFYGINEIKKKIFLPKNKNKKILDLGCGIGFWTNFIDKLNYKKIYACDISIKSLLIAKKRIYKKNIKFSLGNAENLKFPNSYFHHVHCYGVIHHTPNIKLALNEIYRVIKIKGTASISVYYKNIILKNFNILFPFIKIFSLFFLNSKKRGRVFYKIKTLNELIKLYDGKKNPIGNVYTKNEIKKLILNCGFKINSINYTFFPDKFFKFELPFFLKVMMTYFFPFIIIFNLKKLNFSKL